MTEITVRFNLTFSRRFLTSVGAAAIMLCAVPELDSESVTLSTYYPAPSGVYSNMITTGNSFLARDGGLYNNISNPNGTMVAIGGTTVTGATLNRVKLHVQAGDVRIAAGSLSGNYGINPEYTNWAAYGTGDGGAAIYNSNQGSYQALMLVGNNSGGALRRVKVWDELTVNGSMRATAAIVYQGAACLDQVYGLGVSNCPAGRYATYTDGVMVKKTTTVGTTDPAGTMRCCPCPSDGCPNL